MEQIIESYAEDGSLELYGDFYACLKVARDKYRYFEGNIYINDHLVN